MPDRTDEDQPGFLQDNRKGAIISDDGTYRYRLWRMWDAEKPTVAFIMLNPSTADETADDPTCRRCIEYGKSWGYGKLIIGNLFALRSTDPVNLRKHDAPIGPENDQHLKDICDEAEKVIVAWGTDGSLNGRGREVAQLLDEQELYALNTTASGHPNHPLYQPKDATLEPWSEHNLSNEDAADESTD